MHVNAMEKHRAGRPCAVRIEIARSLITHAYAADKIYKFDFRSTDRWI
jgi:hypothetical protein